MEVGPMSATVATAAAPSSARNTPLSLPAAG